MMLRLKEDLKELLVKYSINLSDDEIESFAYKLSNAKSPAISKDNVIYDVRPLIDVLDYIEGTDRAKKDNLFYTLSNPLMVGSMKRNRTSSIYLTRYKDGGYNIIMRFSILYREDCFRVWIEKRYYGNDKPSDFKISINKGNRTHFSIKRNDKDGIYKIMNIQSLSYSDMMKESIIPFLKGLNSNLLFINYDVDKSYGRE